MNNIVTISDGEIRLNSGLNEESFGRTNYFTLIGEKGIIYTAGQGNQFEQWNFEGVKTFSSNKADSDGSPSTVLVHYCGNNPLSKNAITFDTVADNLDAVTLVVQAMTESLKNNIELPVVGAAGIIVDTDQNKVLFLPENIFKYSTNLLPEKKYFELETAWLNNTINGQAAICYERGLIVYRLLTGLFPYTATNEETKNADILDKNFLPIEEALTGINPEFAKSINWALKLNSTSVYVPGKKQKGVSSEDLKVQPDFDFEQLKESYSLKTKLNLTADVIAEKSSAYLKNKNIKIEAQRKIRRNTTAIIIGVCAAVLVVIMTVSTAKRQNAQFTTKGSTSTEIIQNFFYGVNNKSTYVMDPIAKGDGPEKYIDKITDVFLLEKQVTGFTREAPFYYPEKWMFNITSPERFQAAKVFGITNLTIDGNDAEPKLSLYRRNEHPDPVTNEGAGTLEAGDTTTHLVEYYLLQTNLETHEVVVKKVSDKQTFTYNNEKWTFTGINSQVQDVPVNTEQFVSDYLEQLESWNGNVVAANQALREKYEWVPTTSSMIEEMAVQQ